MERERHHDGERKSSLEVGRVVERSSSSSSSSSSSGGGGGSSSGSSSGSSNSSSSSSSSSSSGSGSSRKIGKIRDLVRAEKDNKWIQPHPDRLSNLSSATGVLDRERETVPPLSPSSLSLSLLFLFLHVAE